MDDFVSKPIDRECLFKVLRRWVPKDAVRTIAAAAPASGPSPTPEVRVANIPLVPGIDVQGGLRRLELPWASFKRMLLRFAESQPQTLRDLRAALDQSDWEVAHRHAHSIGGAGGNLSAVELRVCARALELAIKDQTGGYEPLYTAVAAELDRVVTSIRALALAPVTAPVDASGPCDLAALGKALTALTESLENGDIDATQQHLTACEQARLPGALAEDFARVRKFADDYCFAEAGELVTSMQTRLTQT